MGITGWDQIKEHDAGLKIDGEKSEVKVADVPGCEMIMDLGFGACKLQVQVPEKGKYVTPQDLVGKTIGTSFVNLTAEFFSRLESDAALGGSERAAPATSSTKQRTRIVELSGSVEAACALGVADGIVDLVGESSCCEIFFFYSS